MVTYMVEEDDVQELTARFRVEGGDSFQRIRSPKAVRTTRKHKKPSAPGSTRLRRNKHWSW